MSEPKLSLKKLLEDGRISPDEYKKLRRREIWRAILYGVLGLILLPLSTVVAFLVTEYHEDIIRGIKSPVRKVVERVTPDPHIVRFSPRGEIDELGDILVNFSSPIVLDTAVDRIVNDLPVRTDPDLGPNFIWLTTTALKIVLSRPVQPNTVVTVTFDPAFRDMRGRGLFFKNTFSFVYRPFRVDRVEFDDEAAASDGIRFNVRFSASVAAEELRTHLEIEDDGGNAVLFSIPDVDRVSTSHPVVVSLKDLSRRRLTFTFKSGIKPRDSEIRSREDIRKTVGPFDELVVEEVEERGGGAKPAIRIEFNQRVVDPESLKGRILIDDDTAIEILDVNWRSIYITSPALRFGKSVTVTCLPGLRSGAFMLKEECVRTVEISEAQPRVEIKTSGVFQSRQGQWLMPVEWMSVDTMFVTVYQIYKNNLVYYATQEGYNTLYDPLFFKVKEFVYRLNGTPNESHTDYIDLKPILAGYEHGPKVLVFAGNRGSYLGQRLLIMTDLGVSFKRVDKTNVVLVTSLADGIPVADADVGIYSRSNQRLASGRTQSDGVAVFPGVSYEHGEPHIVIVSKGEDISYMVVQRGLLPTAGFDVEGDPYLAEGEFEAAVVGEREIYRPGETARLKVIGRGKRLAIPPAMPVRTTLTAPDGRVVWERDVRLDALGTAELVCPIDASAVTGLYHLKISVPGKRGDPAIGSATLQIEAFMPDRIEANVTPEQTLLRPGDLAKFLVTGRYLFGKPAGGHRVQAVASFEPVPFAPPKFADFMFGDADKKFKDVFQELGETKLDADGRCEYEVAVPDGLKPPAAMKLTFTATVLDIGSRGVSARREIPIHPYPFYIGIKPLTEDLRGLREGVTAEFRIVAVTPDARAIETGVFQASVYRRDWEYAYRADADGNYRHIWEKSDHLVQSAAVRLNAGEAMFAYKTGWGEYRLEVTDTASSVAAARSFAVGWDWEESEGSRKLDFDRLEIKSDRQVYRPGETAKVSIESAFDGQAYIFIEGGGIEWYRRVPVIKRKAQFTLPVRADWPPNVYVSAILLSGSHRTKFGRCRAVGVAPLKVLATDKIYAVTVDAPTDPNPGRRHPIKIRLKDSTGAPAGGVVALSIVDQGVLQLTPLSFGNPYDHFYRKRANLVSNADIFSYINPEPETKVARRLTPSGDESRRRFSPPFRMTAEAPVSEWYPAIRVESGEATLPWKAPQFSGRLVFRAWAVSDGGIGYAKIDRTLKEPVILESTPPRAVASGDSFTVPFEIISNFKDTVMVGIRVRGDSVVRCVFDADVQLPPGGTARGGVPVAVTDGIGMSGIAVQIKSPAGVLDKRYPVAVRPPYPSVTLTDFRVIDAGENPAFDIEPKFIPASEHHRLIISKTPNVRLLAGLDYLIRYPYGCIEQTTSSVFPQIYLKNILALINPQYERSGEIDRNIHRGISRLLSMMRVDGGFSYWPGGGDVYPYGSVYASHFLVEAHRAGYAVPESALRRITEYLQRVLESREDRAIRSYACYVLSIAGIPNTPLALKLLPQVSAPYNYYLVAACVLAGEPQIVADRLNARTPAAPSVGRSTNGVLSSDVTADAVILNALLDSNGAELVIESLVENLYKRARFNGRWGTTHDNALALIALGKYYRRKAEAPAKFSGEMTLTMRGGVSRRIQFDSERDTTVSVDGPLQSIQMRSSGHGSFHLTRISEGIPTESNRVYYRRGITVRRQYYDLAGNSRAADRFAQGELAVVEARIKVDGRAGNLFYEDILAGGFELENPRLSTRVQDIPFLTAPEVNLQPDYVDYKDDRLVVFFKSDGPDRELIFRYLVRAVARGRFVSPSFSAGCMYDPDIETVESSLAVVIE